MVTTRKYMASKHSSSFKADLAANFGCDRFRFMPDTVPQLCVPPSEVAVQFDNFDLNLSRGFLLRQVVDLDPRLQFGTLGSFPQAMPYFELRDWWMIKDWAMRWESLWSAAKSHQFHFKLFHCDSNMKKVPSCVWRSKLPKIYKSFFTLEITST